MSDIWCRFNDWRNFTGDLAAFNGPHRSVWYRAADEIPQIRLVVGDVLDNLPPCRLGGVLITKIPPGGRVEPHVDRGWHARYYRDKFAVQIAGNEQQAFHFEDMSYSALPGEVYWFDNGRLHWVTNDSDEDRITMIICTRAESCRGD